MTIYAEPTDTGEIFPPSVWDTEVLPAPEVGEETRLIRLPLATIALSPLPLDHPARHIADEIPQTIADLDAIPPRPGQPPTNPPTGPINPPPAPPPPAATDEKPPPTMPTPPPPKPSWAQDAGEWAIVRHRAPSHCGHRRRWPAWAVATVWAGVGVFLGMTALTTIPAVIW